MPRAHSSGIMANLPLVTIAVPCRDEERYIEACIRAVQAQDYPRDRIEVFVADGMSVDATRSILARLATEDARIRVLDNRARIQAAGLNECIGRARGEVVVRMDVHADYAPDFVRKCVEVLDRTGADNVGGSARPRAKTFFQRCMAAALASPLAVGGSKYRKPDEEGFVESVWPGAFRRSVFERAGMFDPHAVTNEDAELNQRIVDSGGRVFLSREIVVHYYPRESLWRVARQYFKYGQGRARTLLKHRKLLSWRPAVPFSWLAAEAALLAASRPLLAVSLAVYALAAVAEAVRVVARRAPVRPAEQGLLAVRAIAMVWAIFPVIHVSHGAGFAAGLVRYARTRARTCLAMALAALASGAVAMGACARHDPWPGPASPPLAHPVRATPPPPEPTVGTTDIATRPLGPHPRIVLDADRLAAARGLRDGGAPAWRKLIEQCDEAVRESIAAGYQGWDWANATLGLALCHGVTRRAEYARAAVRYFRALLDDRSEVGDGAGGEAIVKHDDGYSIRTRGCFGAIAYDWLHDAPGMTPDLRAHAADRFVAWTQWFSAEGYNRDRPIANYYVGYFGAVAFAGIALDGDDARAARMRADAQRMYDAEIVPAYRRIAGGDFPEGWQYGDMVGAVLALFAASSGNARAFAQLPWLREIPDYRTHALWPDGKHTFDSGDWSDKPAVAPAHALLALAAVLPPSDEAGRKARALARLATDPHEEWRWLAVLADDPSQPADDPRRGPASYAARGTQTIVARTDWSASAVWVAFASAPSLSDHQHLDAGHFEIVRGGDALVVDSGGYGSFSSLSHNVIAVEDGKENDTYAPNQGTWSDSARIERWQDAGAYVYALADCTSAYNPTGYPTEHAARSVTRAEREIVFSRSPVAALGEASARVVVYDRITLAKPTYGATFLLHGGSTPERLATGGIRFAAGGSAAWVTTILPPGATPAVVAEPTRLGEGAYYANDPPEGTRAMRVETRSAAGASERRFLHAIAVGRAGPRAPAAAARIDGDGADGVVVDDEAYVFARAAPQPEGTSMSWHAPPSVARYVVASLAPGTRYDAKVDRDRDGCRVSIGAGPRLTASRAGVVTIEVGPGCTLR